MKFIAPWAVGQGLHRRLIGVCVCVCVYVCVCRRGHYGGGGLSRCRLVGSCVLPGEDFFTYRIMYELAVCSDGMTEAQPRSFRQNRPANEYIIGHNVHSPANRCSGCSNTRAPELTKNMSFDNFNAALTGQVQVIVTLTTKHDWARLDPQV